MSERTGQCAGCERALHQVERSPGIWRPLLCPVCVADEVTRLGRVVTLELGPWHIYRPGQLAMCPGERARRTGAPAPCTVAVGLVSPGTILRVRRLRASEAPCPPSFVVDCRCGIRREVQTLEQPSRVA